MATGRFDGRWAVTVTKEPPMLCEYVEGDGKGYRALATVEGLPAQMVQRMVGDHNAMLGIEHPERLQTGAVADLVAEATKLVRLFRQYEGLPLALAAQIDQVEGAAWDLMDEEQQAALEATCC